MADSAAFGERIRQLMAENKLSLRRLSAMVPCNAGYLSRLINGRKSPSQRMASRLDEVLGAQGELVALVPQRGRAADCEGCRTIAPPQEADGEPVMSPPAGHPGRSAGGASQHDVSSREPRPGRLASIASPSAAGAWEPSLATHSAAESDLIAAIADATRTHAELAEVTEVGPGTLEQLRVDVIDLARAYVFTAPLPLFLKMNRVRERILDALGRKSHPSQERELYLLAGSLCALMANACLDLGRCKAGDELARATWTYGTIIDHGGLMGWARGTQALAALLDGRPNDAVRYANDGLDRQRTGLDGARLYSIAARALAHTAADEDARHALACAERAHEEVHPRGLHSELGGEFTFSKAKQHYYAAVTRASLGDAQQAEHAATLAIRLYEEAPWQDRSYGCEALARLQLALARLMSGELDGAIEALQPVLTLAPDQRINSLTGYLDTGRKLLRGARFQGSPTAMELEKRLALFCTTGVTRALTSGWNEHSTGNSA